MTASVLKQDLNTKKGSKERYLLGQNFPSNGQENNIVEPKTDKWFSFPS